MNFKSCICCGGEFDYYAKNLIDTRYLGNNKFDYLVCKSCGHIEISIIYQNNLNLINDFYPHDYETHFNVSDSERISMLRSTLRKISLAAYGYYGPSNGYIQRGLRFIFRNNTFLGAYVSWVENSKGLLLDVGCGSGFFLKKMKKIGYNVVGIDPDSKVSARLNLDDIIVHTGFLANHNFGETKFSVITMQHVIEHSVNPELDIRTCHSLLDNQGSLVIITPNSRSILFRLFKKNHWHLDPPRHLNIFSPNSLKQLMLASGFKDVKLFTVNRSFSTCFKNSLLIKQNGVVYKGNNLKFSYRLNYLLYPIWFLLSMVFFSGGDEIVVIAKKV